MKKLTASCITREDCLDIENTINEWIEEGKNDSKKHDIMQNKVKGAVSILHKMDNVKVSLMRNNKDTDIDKIQLQTIEMNGE